MVRLLNADPSLDFIYSDEDKIDADERRILPSSNPAGLPISSCQSIIFVILLCFVIASSRSLEVSAAVMTVHRIMIFSCG